MKKSIRRNVFETNSSSTHSICVTKNNILDDKRDFIEFTLGEYGWSIDTLETTYQKASYLYTAILYNGKPELLENIKTFLKNNSINYEFEEPKYESYGDYKYLKNGYIDHGTELYDFIIDICNDEDKLMRYLFSKESFILTGNDNDYEDVDINVDYAHDEYYKGN